MKMTENTDPEMAAQAKYYVVVACCEARSGERYWRSALGVLFNGDWLPGYDPQPPRNRAGDYPYEHRYEVVPYGGRYRSAGVQGVPREHVPLVKEALRNAEANPHICGDLVFDEDNWIDADIPPSAVRAAAKAEAEHLLQRADQIVWEAQHRAKVLRASARALLANVAPVMTEGE